ncbi:MAG: hypothetical protein R2909_02235 [Gemmatimonadales bacterium]
MYSSCLFCHAGLGSNRAFPGFEVGERLAFDPLRGRLWVVCPWCHRWNLTPLDERWEVIEECERLFRGTRLRFSTDNVGLAHLPSGLSLVRIGKALKPELAAWRYGEYLRRWLPDGVRDPIERASRELGRAVDRGARWVTARFGRRMQYDLATWMRLRHRPNRIVAVADLADGGRAVIRRRHLDSSELVRPDPREPWRLTVAHDGGDAELAGDDGLRVAGKLLAAINGTGASEIDIRYAVAKLDDAANPDGYFARVAAIALRCWWGKLPDAPRDADTSSIASSDAERVALHLTKRSFWGRGGLGSEPRTALPRLPVVDRLALEMAANEDAERQALEGELALLELAWRRAEEIAAIADGLLLAPTPA